MLKKANTKDVTDCLEHGTTCVNKAAKKIKASYNASWNKDSELSQEVLSMIKTYRPTRDGTFS